MLCQAEALLGCERYGEAETEARHLGKSNSSELFQLFQDGICDALSLFGLRQDGG